MRETRSAMDAEQRHRERQSAERETDRERQRERQRETERGTERQRDRGRETERETDAETRRTEAQTTLIITISKSPMRWFSPPPIFTAILSKMRIPVGHTRVRHV